VLRCSPAEKSAGSSASGPQGRKRRQAAVAGGKTGGKKEMTLNTELVSKNRLEEYFSGVEAEPAIS
jgi:hypothetical protein